MQCKKRSNKDNSKGIILVNTFHGILKNAECFGSYVCGPGPFDNVRCTSVVGHSIQLMLTFSVAAVDVAARSILSLVVFT